MTNTYQLRMAAAQRGENTFQGKPCQRHPEAASLRYVSNGICTACVKASAAARQSKLRAILKARQPT